MQATVAVDFDGTLFESDHLGGVVPIKGAAEALRLLRSRGVRIVIHTCRTGLAAAAGSLAEELQWIEEQLRLAAMPFDEIFLGEKPVATVYVDDRAVAFDGDWSKSVAAVLERL